MWRTVPFDAANSDTYLIPPALAVSDDALYFAGGVTASGAPSSELWKHDLRMGRWSTISTEGPAPMASMGHSLVALRGRILLLGARVSPELSSRRPSPSSALIPPSTEELPPAPELWSLAVEPPALASTNMTAPLRWERHAASRSLARLDHCAVPYEQRAIMLIAGGAGRGTGLLDDLWQ